MNNLIIIFGGNINMGVSDYETTTWNVDELHLYLMDECDSVVAYNEDNATGWYKSLTGEDCSEDDRCEEVDFDTYKFFSDNENVEVTDVVNAILNHHDFYEKDEVTLNSHLSLEKSGSRYLFSRTMKDQLLHEFNNAHRNVIPFIIGSTEYRGE